MSSNWLSIPEAASLTGLSEDQLRTAVVMGELSAEPTGNLKEYRVRREDLERYARERGISIGETPSRPACCRFSAVRTLVTMGLIGFSLIVVLSAAHPLVNRLHSGRASGCGRVPAQDSFINVGPITDALMDLLNEEEILTSVYPEDLGSVPDVELHGLIEVWSDFVARIEREPADGVAPMLSDLLDTARRRLHEVRAEQLRRSF